MTETTDRELLEMAAKAAGINGKYDIDMGAIQYKPTMTSFGTAHCYWNPLIDDCDALRLAVSLSIDVMHRFVGGRRCEALAPGGKVVEVFYQTGDDPNAATRRAIVRAAAAIGKEMR